MLFDLLQIPSFGRIGSVSAWPLRHAAGAADAVDVMSVRAGLRS